MATAATAPATRLAREYETIYILRPDVDNDTAEKVADRAIEVIKRLDGTLTKLDNWGKRRLAYPIRKNARGIFVYLKYVGFGDLVAELERNLRLLDQVVRFQTVLLREDVDPATIAVDPEEIQYLHLEDQEEDEDAETERARSLGMIAPQEERSHDDASGGGDDESAKAASDGEGEKGTSGDSDAKAASDDSGDGDSDAKAASEEDASGTKAASGDASGEADRSGEPRAEDESSTDTKDA